MVFEGWDASGKGGAIRRLTEKLDPRGYVVYPIAAPKGDDATHHYLWRFWRRLPEAGQIAIFDRSWYGRVMVERIEGFCSEAEWKRAYRRMMLVMLKNDIFPEDIRQALSKSIVNAKASSTSELELSRILLRYDENNDETRVEDLTKNTIFQTQNGMQFKKGDKQRTRYKCLNLQNNRLYLFHPLTPVRKV